jgi:hypothetical protein
VHKLAGELLTFLVHAGDDRGVIAQGFFGVRH